LHSALKHDHFVHTSQTLGDVIIAVFQRLSPISGASGGVKVLLLGVGTEDDEAAFLRGLDVLKPGKLMGNEKFSPFGLGNFLIIFPDVIRRPKPSW
jgi:hypothetical protein